MQSIETPASIYELDNLCTVSLGKYILEVTVSGGTLNDVQVDKIIGMLEELTKGKEYLVLINCAPTARLTIKAIQKLATNKAFTYAIAKAYVISSPLQRVAALIFGVISLSKKYPVKFFTNRTEVASWLKELVIY